MVTRQQRLNDFESNGQPPAGELMELLCEDHNGTYVLPFPVFGLMARGAAVRSDVRLKPTSLGGEGNEIERRDNGTDATGLHIIVTGKSVGPRGAACGDNKPIHSRSLRKGIPNVDGIYSITFRGRADWEGRCNIAVGPAG